jgi:uncharacterized membrane protein YkoI
MKTRIPALIAAGLLALSLPLVPTASAGKGKAPKSAPAPTEDDASEPVGSIRPTGKLKATERAALAKITLADAQQMAVSAVPGQVTYGELVVEDGNLQFDFQIIGPEKKVTDVAIDAGDGKVLDNSKGDDV